MLGPLDNGNHKIGYIEKAEVHDEHNPIIIADESLLDYELMQVNRSGGSGRELTVVSIKGGRATFSQAPFAVPSNEKMA